jgi:hypothetical protein
LQRREVCDGCARLREECESAAAWRLESVSVEPFGLQERGLLSWRRAGTLDFGHGAFEARRGVVEHTVVLADQDRRAATAREHTRRRNEQDRTAGSEFGLSKHFVFLCAGESGAFYQTPDWRLSILLFSVVVAVLATNSIRAKTA